MVKLARALLAAAVVANGVLAVAGKGCCEDSSFVAAMDDILMAAAVEVVATQGMTAGCQESQVQDPRWFIGLEYDSRYDNIL